VALVGGHDPAPPSAGQTGKPVWFSEDFHSTGGDRGAGTWASQINRRYLQYNMTATIAWNACSAFYAGLSFDDTGLAAANSPWSGNYAVLGTIWATAHTTQFTAPGWRFLRVDAGAGGAGFLAAGGSYVAYTDPATGNWTLVVEKFSNDGDPVCQAEEATFCLGGSLPAAAAAAGPLAVWRSTFTLQPGETSDYFTRQAPVTPDASACFSISIPVDSLTTVTTLVAAGGKGDHGPPPPAAPFPLPYADDFSACVPPGEARYWADISGTWECVADGGGGGGGGGGGIVMRMVTPAKPVSWESDWRPHAVLGDPAWADVNFTSSLRLSSPADVALLGVRCSLLNQTNYAALMAEIAFPGLWLAVNATGGWSLWPSIQAAGVWSAPPLASGALPGHPLAPGTWHTVSLVSTRDTLAAFIDGVPAFAGLSVSAQAYTGWVGIGTADWGMPVDWRSVEVTPA
jgi:hypothetical protein